MQVQPYINFEGHCEEALDFYRRALGAEIEGVMRVKEAPPEVQGMMPPGTGDKVMHASFRIGETHLLAMDGRSQGKPQFQGISLALTAADADEVTRHFNALADGGKVEMPLAKTFFAPMFGMVTDKFGITWMILAAA
ncbi:MAG: VOC family protein [Stellaceae bacterium]